MNVGKYEPQIVGEKLRDGRGGAQAHDVDVPRSNDLFDGVLEGADVQLVQRGSYVLYIRLEHLVEHLGVVHVRGHFKSLGGRQPVADQLLQRLLQMGIAAVAQRRREAHHRGFGYAHIFPQLRCGHEDHLVVMGHDALSDATVALG